MWFGCTMKFDPIYLLLACMARITVIASGVALLLTAAYLAIVIAMPNHSDFFTVLEWLYWLIYVKVLCLSGCTSSAILG